METIIQVKTLNYDVNSIDENSIKIDEFNHDIIALVCDCIVRHEEKCYTLQQKCIMEEVLYALCNNNIDVYNEVLDMCRDIINDDDVDNIEYGDVNYSILDEFLNCLI